MSASTPKPETITDLVSRLGISRDSYYKRRRAGLTHDQAITEAVAKRRGPYRDRVER